MPAFQGAELAQFARVWREGTRVFNQVVRTMPLEKGRAYNLMDLKATAPDKGLEVFTEAQGLQYLDVINAAEKREEAYHAKLSLIMALGEEVIERKEKQRA